MKPPPLSLEEAQARLLALAAPLPVENIAVANALGRYLAAPLIAQRTQPARDMSAMDGYAVGAGDLAGPWRVVGESAAGHPFAGTFGSGEAVRIATGALLPPGAETVILQEDVSRDGDCLALATGGPAQPGRHLRRAGMDFRSGDILLPAGAAIGPAQIGLALAGGHHKLAVHRRPRLAIIDSGDELSADGADCAPHQIPASNGSMLAAMACILPCDIKRIGPVSDDLSTLTMALRDAADADVIVTSGGASVGDHDLIRPALEFWGAKLDFWRVAIKPGKPILVAQRGRQLVLGLPGNPVSSHVTAFLFLLPLLRALLGAQSCLPIPVISQLGSALAQGGSRREFLRAHWNGRNVTAFSLQDSGALSTLAASNALIDRPAGAPAGAIGEPASIYLLANGGIA